MFKTMKFLMLFFPLLSALQAFAQSTDMIVYSKVRTKWNVFLFHEFNQLMRNVDGGIDLAHYRSEEPIFYGEATIDEMVSEDIGRLITRLEEISKLSILNVTPKLQVDGFGYDLDEIHPVITLSESANGDVTFHSKMKINGLQVSAKKISLSLNIDVNDGEEKIPALIVEIHNPRLTVLKEHDLRFDLDVTMVETPDRLSLLFPYGDFSEVKTLMETSPESVTIDYDKLVIPEIKLELMGREFIADPIQIELTIKKHFPAIKKILLNQIQEVIKKDGLMNMMKGFEADSYGKFDWFGSTSFPMLLDLKDMSAYSDSILRMDIGGNFCSVEGYAQYGAECVNHRLHTLAKSQIDENSKASARKNLEEIINRDGVNMVASLSEDYINKALVALIDDGAFDEDLEDMGIKFGSETLQVRMIKPGGSVKVYVDTVYEPSKTLRRLLGQKQIRFPVVLDAAIRVEYLEVDIENRDATGKAVKQLLPHLILTITDAELDNNIFWNGVAEYNLPSTIRSVRYGLRKLVIRQIKKELYDFDAETQSYNSTWKGEDLPPLLFPELMNLKLEKMQIESDGSRRLNVIMTNDVLLD